MINDRSLRPVFVGDRWVHTRGLPWQPWQDFYHQSMTVSWPRFITGIALLFLGINFIFACLYGLGEASIANLSPPGFAGRFFFSVETLATVGYGDMHPQSLFGHFVATAEIFSGLVSTALTTGLVFARFSLPRSRILFARHPVVTRMNGRPSLIIRAANARQNVIVDASAKLSLILRETTSEGETLRRIYDLTLVRNQHPIFLLGWSLIHHIDDQSPLHSLDANALAERHASLILTINGVDETTSQNMQGRETYAHSAIRWNHSYVDLFVAGAGDIEVMDYGNFHSVKPNTHE